jgi:ribosome modulation factor
MTATATAAADHDSRTDDQDAAYDEGMRAFTAGLLLSACPYPERSPERDAWESGWFDFAHAVEMLPDD